MEQSELVVIQQAPLTLVERAKLDECEKVIARGLETFYEVGQALSTIRQDRLYRAVDATFEAYCSNRWGITSARARQLMYAAGIAGHLIGSVPMGESVTIVTIPEAQLRPLTPLRNDPDLLRDTWEEAHEIASERGEKFTARHVEKAVEAARPKAAPIAFDPPTPMAVHFSSATPEHYSPAHIVEMAREVMHAIDLDPASCVQANETIAAAHWYGLDHPNEAMRDGLAAVWFGRVWMNPPYGDEIALWTDRLVHQYAMENVIEAIALIPARTDTAWFKRSAAGRVVCFITGRLKFGNAENSAPFPSALIYFGEDAEKFRAVFGSVGLIATFGGEG